MKLRTAVILAAGYVIGGIGLVAAQVQGWNLSPDTQTVSTQSNVNIQPTTNAPAFTVGSAGKPVSALLNGLPWTAPALSATQQFNVKNFGAIGNSSADDTAGIQAAINAAATAGGGQVIFPPGGYCVKGLNIVISTPGISLVGQNRHNATGISRCGTHGNVITINGGAFHDEIWNLQINGDNAINTTFDTVLIQNCSECALFDNEINFGRFPINAQTGELRMYGNKVSLAYGAGLINLIAASGGMGGYILENKLDQNYPGTKPLPNTLAIAGWASTTGYTANTSFVTTGGYLLQALATGTSGSVAPTPPTYGTTVIDGTVTWALVGAVNNTGILCDTGCGGSLIIDGNDITGSYYSAIALQNSLAGIAPNFVYIINNIMSANINNELLIGTGDNIQVINNELGGTMSNNGILLIINSNTNVNIQVTHNLASSSKFGFYNQANNTFVDFSHNNFSSIGTTALLVDANTAQFTMVGNQCTFSGATCISVPAGTSDHYNIVNNLCGSAATCVSDAGSGTHKTVIGNN